MPPEQKKEWNGMNEVKQDLEGARLQQQLEQSCWKTNNEKKKLDMVLWNTSQNYGVTTCHSPEKNWIGMNKETRKYFTGRIKKILGPL